MVPIMNPGELEERYSNVKTTREINLQSQLDYMCQEIATALGLPVQSPAETVQSVRELAAMADKG